MASSWLEKARVARLLSNAGEENFGHQPGYGISSRHKQYFQKICDHLKAANVDKRYIAVADDFEFMFPFACANATEEFSDAVLEGVSLGMMWHLLFEEKAEGEQRQVLNMLHFPIDTKIKNMSEDKIHYTFINNVDLNYYEKYYVNTESSQKYGPITYSSISYKDLVSDSYENYFDNVLLHSNALFRFTDKIMHKVLNTLKVNGTAVISSVSHLNGMYNNSDQLHLDIYADFNRAIARRGDLVSFHIAAGQGILIIKKVK